MVQTDATAGAPSDFPGSFPRSRQGLRIEPCGRDWLSSAVGGGEVGSNIHNQSLCKGERNMIKKVLIGVGVVFLGAVLIFGRDAFSYVRTSVRHVKDSVRNSVPVQVEIERARD